MIDIIETSNTSSEVTELITRWREIFKRGIYRMTGEDGSVTIHQSSFAMKEKLEKRGYNS